VACASSSSRRFQNSSAVSGNVDVVGVEQVLVGGATALDLLGLGLGGGHLRLQRGDVGAGTADLRVERIRFGLGQIQDCG
jgi:hypothetical protein